MLASSSNRVAWRRVLLAGLAGIGLAGCSERSEFDRPGTWKPLGANDQNLRAMIANPSDLYVGEAATTARGDSGARAVTRLLLERRRSLLNVTTSKIAPPQDASDAPLGATGGGGTGGGGLSSGATGGATQ